MVNLGAALVSTSTFNLSASGNSLTLNDGGLATYTVNGGAVVDTITITGGNLGATLNGNAGNDVLTGGTGNDTLNGGDDNDSMTAGNGNDTLNGGLGNDTMIGGLGNDTYVVDSAIDVTTEAAAGGTDLVQSSVTLTLGAEVENLTLTGASAINGTGNGLANVLTGNSGINTLSAGALNDTLNGGAANDILNGGTGADQFVFTNTTSGVDTIQDFNEVEGGGEEGDQMVFTGLLTGGFAYMGTAAFSGGSDNSEARIVGNQVLVDSNGDGTADITITMTGLNSASQLAISDFLWN